MLYKYFDKKASGGAIKELPKELHKQLLENL